MVISHMASFEINDLIKNEEREECHQKVTYIGGGLTEKGGVIYEQKYEGKLKHFTF